MQIQFDAIEELGIPNSKFKTLFDSYWPAYNAWLEAKKPDLTADLKTSKAALKKYMPEMIPTYKRLCKLVKADPVAAQFLTGFQPPVYISACSQAVLIDHEIQLIRNNDYHPDLFEGTLLLSSWNGKKVIATSDCLIGAVDGMNEDGLAISLTFGGRRVVGKGFGIPFILRYVLEFCSTVSEAVRALKRIPCHMSYNVTVADKSGVFKTILLSPDRGAIVTDAAFTTNHQIEVDWVENAAFNKTIERSEFLRELLKRENLSAEQLTTAFLKKPLYNESFSEAFGTLYTAIYRPGSGEVKLLWPDQQLTKSFDDFSEESVLVKFSVPNENETVHLDKTSKESLQVWIDNKSFPQPSLGGSWILLK